MKASKYSIIILILFLTACAMPEKNEEKKFDKIRFPKAAGQYYPAEADRLKFRIEKYLKEAETEKIDGEIKAILVPHAGYDYSGPVAAFAYKPLAGKQINTAIIICNSHTAYFDGVAIDESEAWETPLGLVEVDHNLAKKLVSSDPVIKYNSQIFEASDQTIEVQVPFLQVALAPGFKILPIFFGNQTDEAYKKLAKALADNLGPDDLVVVSSDMSHYPSYEDANKIDKESLEIVASGDIAELKNYVGDVLNRGISGEQTVFCGLDGVKTVMELYNVLGWNEIKVLKYANSGDIEIGDKKSVVGYGAMAFIKIENEKLKMKNVSNNNEKDENVLSNSQKEELLKIARETVEGYVRAGQAPEFSVSDKRLFNKEGAFVTLHKGGELRGCISQIVPSNEPLYKVVREMAVAACSEDHRFNPISKDELGELDYEVSVLSEPKKINDWREIQLGKQGVIVKKGLKSGVFLPQVADETGWSQEEFLAQLCWQKAGLAPDCYKSDPEIELYVFTAQVF